MEDVGSLSMNTLINWTPNASEIKKNTSNVLDANSEVERINSENI
jgi:hypothetical protein